MKPFSNATTNSIPFITSQMVEFLTFMRCGSEDWNSVLIFGIQKIEIKKQKILSRFFFEKTSSILLNQVFDNTSCKF